MDTEIASSSSDVAALRSDESGELSDITEGALRQLATRDSAFEVHVEPLYPQSNPFWRIVLRFPGDSREHRLVDARLNDRRWKQLNALTRFVCRSCGSGRRLTVNLDGIDPALLTTKGD